MLEALFLGVLGQTSLLLSGLLACWVRIPTRMIGVLGGLGSGALLAAVSFDLIVEAETLETGEMSAWMLVGVAVFLGGEFLVSRMFRSGKESDAMGIVVGSVVDGVPESIIFGIQLATGFPVSTAFLASVWASNIPQAIAPSADLAANGRSPLWLGMLWSSVVLACGAASVLGYVAGDSFGAATGERIAALAAGGILAMLATSLIPFSDERGGALAGVATVVGFCASFAAT